MIEYAHAATTTVAKMDMWSLVWNAGPIAKSVILLLIGFSIVSWAILLTKRIQLASMAKSNEAFQGEFWKATSLDAVFAELDQFKASTMAQVFRAGYLELQNIAETQKKDTGATTKITSLSGLDNIARSLRKAHDNEITRMEERVSFLATIGSTSPFIGLFGTVWGIMSSFQDIGVSGAASLAVVAPGISEALIATAIGLFAAIPAVMGYNYFIGKFKKLDIELNNFSYDFLNIAKRNFFKD